MEVRAETRVLWVNRQQLHDMVMSGNLMALEQLERLEDRGEGDSTLDVAPHPALYATDVDANRGTAA